jgi:hypothetical protein
MQYEDEYWTKVRQAFYKQVKETNWGVEEHRVSKPRGRKAQPKVVAEQTLKTKQEYKRVQPTKFFNFH